MVEPLAFFNLTIRMISASKKVEYQRLQQRWLDETTNHIPGPTRPDINGLRVSAKSSRTTDEEAKCEVTVGKVRQVLTPGSAQPNEPVILRQRTISLTEREAQGLRGLNLDLGTSSQVYATFTTHDFKAMDRAFEQATGGGAPQPAENTANVRRIAFDGQAYTWTQYVEAYGDDAHRCWDEARGPSILRRVAFDGRGGAPQPAESTADVEQVGDDAQRFWDDASQLAVNEYAEPQPTASIDEETLLLPSIPEGAAASHVQAEDPWAIQDWRRHRDPRFVRRDACRAPVEDPAEDAREEAREARLGNHEPDGMPYTEHQRRGDPARHDSDASQLAIDVATPHDDRDVNPDASRGIPWPEEAVACTLYVRRPALLEPVPPVPCANEIPQRWPKVGSAKTAPVGAIPWPKVAPPRLQENGQCGLYQDAVVAWGFVTMRCIELHYSHCMTQALQTITVRRATLSLERARRSGRAVRAPPGEQASPVAPPDDRDVNPDSSSSGAPVSLANPPEG